MRTIAYYKLTICNFFAQVRKIPEQVTDVDVKVYMSKRMLGGVSKTTVNNEYRNLSSFYAWAQKEEIILKNPMNKVDKVKERKVQRKAFTEMEIELIRAACKTKRERALVEVLLSTWCRISEVRSMKAEDCLNEKLQVIGKGNKERTVYMSPRAIIAVSEYMKERHDSNPYLFPRSKDHLGKLKGREEWYIHKENVSESEPVRDISTLEAIIRNIGKRAGVDDCHPHRFRRTGATLALRHGMSITIVSKILGHESISTTQIYLDISNDEIEENHKKYAY